MHQQRVTPQGDTSHGDGIHVDRGFWVENGATDGRGGLACRAIRASNAQLQHFLQHAMPRFTGRDSGVSSALQILNFSQLVSPAPDPNTAQGTKERSAWASVSQCGSSTPHEWETRRVLPERRNEAGLLSPCGGSPEFRGEEDVCLQALTGGKLKRGPAWSEGAIRKAEAEEAEEAEWATPAMSPAAFPSPAAMADLKSPATPILQDMQHCQNHHIFQVERCSVNPPEVA
jgi:hypothetical protein